MFKTEGYRWAVDIFIDIHLKLTYSIWTNQDLQKMFTFLILVFVLEDAQKYIFICDIAHKTTLIAVNKHFLSIFVFQFIILEAEILYDACC